MQSKVLDKIRGHSVLLGEVPMGAELALTCKVRSEEKIIEHSVLLARYQWVLLLPFYLCYFIIIN